MNQYGSDRDPAEPKNRRGSRDAPGDIFVADGKRKNIFYDLIDCDKNQEYKKDFCFHFFTTEAPNDLLNRLFCQPSRQNARNISKIRLPLLFPP